MPVVPGDRGGEKSDEESECESEDGVGEAVLSDYDSADPEENGSHSEGGEEEEEEGFTEETTASAAVEETKPSPPPEQAPPRELEENCSKEDSKSEDKANVTGERQSGDGQESTDDPETKSGGKQQLDDDEDRKNPAYIPRKGLFFEHDLRGASHEEERPKGRNRKLWKDEGRWEHDKFREEEQAPKSREELIAIYGYDIRNGGSGGERRQRRSNRQTSPSRDKRWRDSERPLRSWQSTAPNRAPPQAPPPQPLNQPALSVPRTRAAPQRTRNNQNNPPYRTNEALRPAPPHSKGERHSQKVALEFTAGGGGVATTRGGRGFRGAPLDDVSDSHVTSDLGLNENTVYAQTATEQKPLPPSSSDPAPPASSSSSANREDSPSTERPVERKSYSLVRRTRSRPADMGSKQTSVEDTPTASPKPWAAGGEGPGTGAPTTGLSDMDQDLARLSLGQNWSQNPTSYIRSEIRGLSSPLQMSGSQISSGQFQALDEINSNRAKRYSSQRQRNVPEPAPPLHLGVMEGHYYEPMSYQGPIYTHGDGPAPMPPQSMLVQPEMHLPHPGLHPHQSGGPITNPALYGAPPVSLSPGQPQQLLPPPFYPPPGVMTFPYPAMYTAPQAQSQVTYGGVTYYDTVQQQAQPKPSPPRRTSQPVTVKAPPPDLSKPPPPELPFASE